MTTTRIFIRDKLTRRGLTLVRLADAMGVTPGAVTRWANGMALPEAAKLPALAAALGCTVDDLYRGEVKKDA